MISFLIFLIFSLVLTVHTHTKIYPVLFLATIWSLICFGISLWIVEGFSLFIVIPTILSFVVAWGVFWAVNYLYESIFWRAVVLVLGVKLMLLTLGVGINIEKKLTDKVFTNRHIPKEIESILKERVIDDECINSFAHVE